MTLSAVDPQALEPIRKRIFLALFTALAVALHTLEFLLPSPVPWFRFGFANIFTLTALFLYGGRAAWTLVFTRILVGSLLIGNLFSPGFLLSLSGGVLATTLMTGLHRLGGKAVGPVGISVVGAIGHATGQFLVAWLLLVRHEGLWLIFPFLLLFSFLSGLANGITADLLVDFLKQQPAFRTAGSKTESARELRRPA